MVREAEHDVPPAWAWTPVVAPVSALAGLAACVAAARGTSLPAEAVIAIGCATSIAAAAWGVRRRGPGTAIFASVWAVGFFLLSVALLVSATLEMRPGW